MKNVKVFRILSTVIFLPLFLLATLATPVQATRGITLSPAEGKIGDLITITGTELIKVPSILTNMLLSTSPVTKPVRLMTLMKKFLITKG